MTHDMLTFINQRIDQLEQKARSAIPGPWRYNPFKQWHAPKDLPSRRNGEEFVACGPDSDPICVCVTGPASYPQSMADASHIAAWDPKAVYAVIGGWRALLELHKPVTTFGAAVQFQCGHCASLCHSRSGLGCDPVDAVWPCPTVRAAAAVWRDHPDWREEWVQ